MGKTVPLVVYKNGKRIVVGDAFVEESGKISAQITVDTPETAFLKEGTILGFSLDTEVIPDGNA